MWFIKLIVSFFFFIDKLVYGFIPTIYDLLIQISRTTILSQSEINEFYQKVYLLLAVFMLFKVGFSLITYVVNPDDFSDKNKGVGKIGQNVIISLCLLVLVPYVFSMAYELQTIVLEDNILAKLLLNKKNDNSIDYLNTAGESMAFTTLNAFYTPNVSLNYLYECTAIYDNEGSGKLNPKCFGVNQNEDGTFSPTDNSDSTMHYYVADDNKTDETKPLTREQYYTYLTGLRTKQMDLMFRLDFTKATTINNRTGEDTFLIDYKPIFSTVTGIIVVFLLVGFCLDVGLRSVKLAFLQMMAPIPIISYIDPKSGKDGIFKKWYKMCFSTFLSLFVRLFALYFAVYIITQVGQMTDVVNGALVSNRFVQIFIIIGVLMFAKQLPKILEGLGIKMDGDGKFNLNPLKKMEDGALGGKRLTGAAAGFAVGALGNKGNPLKAIGGAFRGASGNQGLSGAARHQADVNKQLRQAKLDGSTIGGRMNARWQNLTGAKGFNNVESDRKHIESLKKFADAGGKIENRAIEKIKNGEAKDLSEKYLSMEARAKKMQEAYSKNQEMEFLDSNGKRINRKVTEQDIAQAQMAAGEYLNNAARDEYIKRAVEDESFDAAMTSQLNDFEKYAQEAGKSTYTIGKKDDKGNTVSIGKQIHSNVGATKGEITELDIATRDKDVANQANQKYVEAAKIKK